MDSYLIVLVLLYRCCLVLRHTIRLKTGKLLYWTPYSLIPTLPLSSLHRKIPLISGKGYWFIGNNCGFRSCTIDLLTHQQFPTYLLLTPFAQDDYLAELA